MPRDLGWKRSPLNQSATRVYLAGQCIAPRRNGWVDNESGEMGRQHESEKETVIWKRGALEGHEVNATRDGSRGMARVLSLGSLAWLSTSCFLLVASSILNDDVWLMFWLASCDRCANKIRGGKKRWLLAFAIENCIPPQKTPKHSKYWRTHCNLAFAWPFQCLSSSLKVQCVTFGRIYDFYL